MASPRSSLIISDEALSSETGKGTEFVVLMSAEPQGGIKARRRNPETEFRYAASTPALLALAVRRSLFHLVTLFFVGRLLHLVSSLRSEGFRCLRLTDRPHGVGSATAAALPVSQPSLPPRNTGRRHTGSADRGKATISSAWGNDKMPCQQSSSSKTK
jgi:hypothetical protein